MGDKMKILLANFSKMVEDTGGAAKVNCAFANEMHRNGHEVASIYIDDKEGRPFFPIDDGINFYNLSHYQGRNLLFPKRYKIRREIYRAFSQKKARAINDLFIEKFLLSNVKDILERFRPDVIICFQPAASKVFISDLGTSIPVITMSHGDPEDYFYTYPPSELPSLGKSAVCQVLMPSFEKAIKKRYPDVPVVVIGNVVPQYEMQADLLKMKRQYTIIFVGRLVRNHKRPHLLIEAFSRLAGQFSDWNVEIWGADDNPRYTRSLREQIKKAGLEKRVLLKGTTKNVANVLIHGDLFVFPSAYEGFGLSIAEGMSMGLPAVAYRSCAAVNELVQDGISGYLCEDGVQPLADRMKVLMENRDLRVKMGQAARESMRQYAAENIWRQWKDLLEKVVPKG